MFQSPSKSASRSRRGIGCAGSTRRRAGKTGRRARFRRERTPRRAAAPSGHPAPLVEIRSTRPAAHPPAAPGVPRAPRRRAAGAARSRSSSRSRGSTPRGSSPTTRCSRPAISVGIADLRVDGDLHFWINEGLMAIFFLVAGLEIKRELKTGRAAPSPRRPPPGGRRGRRDGRSGAPLPRANVGTGPGARGWGDPDGDGRRVRARRARAGGARRPGRLRPLLLALAIVDDIGSVVVVALFSAGRGLRRPGSPRPFSVSCARGAPPEVHVRATVAYVALGGALWYAMYRVGAPSGARRRRARAADPVGAVPASASRERGGTSDGRPDRGRPSPPGRRRDEWLRLAAALARRCLAAHPRRAPPVAVEQLRGPASVRARQRGGGALRVVDQLAAAGERVAWACPRRSDRRQGAGHLGRALVASRLRLARSPRRRPVRRICWDGGRRGHRASRSRCSWPRSRSDPTSRCSRTSRSPC